MKKDEVAQSQPEKKKAPIDFMAEYNAMFGGAADGKKPPVAAVAVPPPPAKRTTSTQSTGSSNGGAMSFPSLSMGPSISSLMKNGGVVKTGGTLDAALIGTSLDLMKSDGTGATLLIPGATPSSSMDMAVTAVAAEASAVAAQTAPVAEDATPIEQAAAKVLGRAVAVAAPPAPEPAKPAKTPAKKRRRPRKKKPEPPKDYIVGHQPTENDVLLGRGGRSNHWAGNKRYRKEVHNLQHWYKSSAKNEKTDLSQCLVNYVHQYGGRFLKLDESCQRWYVVPNLVARRKASQALREHMTPEEREAFKAGRKARSNNNNNNNDDEGNDADEEGEPMEEV
uniref:DUF6824 domain-containing protein n=1 Tax=Grammatophora oceanica TaxID=210454 RepID=A0A7S1URE3_9STRA